MKKVYRILILTSVTMLLCVSTAFADALNSYKATFSGNTVKVEMQFISTGDRDSIPLAIFDMSGNRVRGVADEELDLVGKDRYEHNIYKCAHSFNLAGLPSGTYIARDTYSGMWFKFKFTARPALYYKGTKVVTNSDGDLIQKLLFNQFYTKGKQLHVNIYDQYGDCVKKITFTSSGKKIFQAVWNGWPDNDSAEKCPNGIYTAKYWIEGRSPKTIKFRLSL